MISAWKQMWRRRRDLRAAMWVLLLLAGTAQQVVATTHWHTSAVVASASGIAQPQAPSHDGIGHDGCLLCQAAAHAGGAAPPPAPWSLFVIAESRSLQWQAEGQPEPSLRPSHSWQGRAPPQA